ncbi:MAG: hypothetical protein SFY69_12950 [Planctomycetota bacterium]|nr:hypothetical protein [Planctomycetota bacterium]
MLPVIVLAACNAPVDPSPTSRVLLKFSDGRESLQDLAKVNEVLGTVGVHLSTITLPPASVPLLESSVRTPLSDADRSKLLELFALSRQDVLEQVRMAGRLPVLPDGGSMVTGEPDVAPYPKVYDLRSMSAQDRLSARDKFARLHVNSTDTGTGVDEVMTLVAGGPWTWYFLLKDNVVVELHMSRVGPSGTGWRLSYPGLTPHGGHFHAESGLCVAYITGPQVWTMRYEAPGHAGERMLGSNPWIDFNDR